MGETKGFTVWFTGLPFSGKKKLAAMLAAELEALGIKSEIIDGGRFRRRYEKDLGFSREEVAQNVRRICFMCRILTEKDVAALAVTISPYRDLRAECRREIGRFVEVYCRAPLEELKRRDTKGLYAAAENGEIADVAGISAPYEPPDKPEFIFDSDKESVEKGLARILKTLQMLGYIPEITHQVLTDEEERLIRRYLKDMGYL